MSRVFSLDLSLSASGWCLAVDGVVREHGLVPGVGEGTPRLVYIRGKICDRIDDCKPDLVVFEDFSYGSLDGKAAERYGLGHMLRAEMFTDKIPWCLVSPLGLKKFIVGTAGSPKAKVTKDLIIKEIFKRFSHDVNDNNVADAIGLAYVGMAALGEWECQITAQREAVAKVLENHPHLKPLVRAVQVGQTVQTVQQSQNEDW